MTPAKKQPVDLADVDLALLGFAGVGDVHARQEAERNGLLGDREGAGDDRLAGDYGHQCGKHDQGDQRPGRRHQEEGIGDGMRIGMHEGALAKIVQDQRRAAR